MCCDHVEGGMYIGPEFQLGQVYDGTGGDPFSNEPVVLYRPVYICIPSAITSTTPSAKTRKMVFDGGSKGAGARSSTSSSLLSKMDSSSALGAQAGPSGLGVPGRARSNTGGTNPNAVSHIPLENVSGDRTRGDRRLDKSLLGETVSCPKGAEDIVESSDSKDGKGTSKSKAPKENNQGRNSL